MRFGFSFRLDKRRKLDNGNYTIKVNLHDKTKNRNYDFTIKPAFTQSGERIEFNCNHSDWESLWINKDKKNSLGEVVGETTVHGKRFELRTLLKIKQDILIEIISREGITSYKEIKEAFYSHQTDTNDWDDVYAGLEDLAKYHEKRESYNYADGFITTINNFRVYLNGADYKEADVLPFKLTEVTVEWLKEYEQQRRTAVSGSAVRKDLVNLRTAYNKAAIKNEVLKVRYPFGKKNNGYSMPKVTSKNIALQQADIDKLKEFSSDNWYLQSARDFFLISYGLYGANMTDIARLEKGAKIFTRKKTKETSGAQIKVRGFTPEMVDIVDRHKGSGKYYFNIIDEIDSEKEKIRKIKAKTDQVSDQTKKLAKLLDLSGEFTFQWARHTVGYQLASSKRIPMKGIQELFGHTTQRTTEGYVKSVFNENQEDIDDILDL